MYPGASRPRKEPCPAVSSSEQLQSPYLLFWTHSGIFTLRKRSFALVIFTGINWLIFFSSQRTEFLLSERCLSLIPGSLVNSTFSYYWHLISSLHYFLCYKQGRIPCADPGSRATGHDSGIPCSTEFCGRPDQDQGCQSLGKVGVSIMFYLQLLVYVAVVDSSSWKNGHLQTHRGS